MDTKQAQINTFTDGLNTDLHPLTTPNTMLTDCINGTVITYNGNEYILQNDMGNYQLKKAQLPADYIPVGVKEYGSIIYIVSYNPIDKKCQIGSYPSPQTLFDNTPKNSKNDSYHGIQINKLDENWVWDSDGLTINGSKDVLFTNYSPQQNITILFPETGNLEDTFLNPGDKYWLYNEMLDKDYDPSIDGDLNKDKNSWLFQKIDYYTLTESKEVYKTEGVKEQGTTIISDNMPSVTWETPGWLGYKPSLLNLESFNVYLTDIKLPSFVDVTLNNTISFSMQAQATVNTSDDWMVYLKKLKVLFEIKYDDGDYQFLGRLENGIIDNYGNKIDVVTLNLNVENRTITDNNKNISIRATPYLLENKLGVVFDNFKIEHQININDLYSLDEIKVFDTYKYLVDNEGITINFSINSPTVKINNTVVKYCIFGFTQEFDSLQVLLNRADYIELPDANLLGQNILEIPFDKILGLENGFYKEEIYLLSINIEGKNFNQLLITSEIFNSFYKDINKFQDILLDEWLPKAYNYQSSKTTITYTNNPILKNSYFSVQNLESLLNDNSYTTYEEAKNIIKSNQLLVVNTGNLVYDNIPVKFILDSVSVFNSNGIWSNLKYTSVGELMIKSSSNITNNYTIKKKFDTDKKTEEIINYKYLSGSATQYALQDLVGTYGDRYYLYKSLYPRFYTEQKILIKGSSDFFTGKELNKFQGRSKDNDNGFAILYWGDKDNRWLGFGERNATVYTDSNNAYTFSLDTKNINTALRTENSTDVNNYIRSIVKPSTSLFIPIVFRKVRDGDSNASFLIDGDYSYHDTNGDGFAIGILCKQGPTIYLAAANLNNTYGYITYWGDSSYYIKSNLLISGDNFNKNNKTYGKFILGLGLHIYSYVNINRNYIYKVYNKYSNKLINTASEFKASINRSDTITEVLYKSIDLTKTSVDLSKFNLCLNNNNLTLSSNVIFNTKNTKLSENCMLENITVDPDVNYIYSIDSYIDNEKENIKKLDGINESTALVDPVENTTLTQELENFAKDLIVEENSNKTSSIFYLNKTPDIRIGTVVKSSQYKRHIAHGIDAVYFSSYNSKDYLDSLFTVSEEFKKFNK